jgi:hypothetical protein
VLPKLVTAPTPHSSALLFVAKAEVSCEQLHIPGELPAAPEAQGKVRVITGFASVSCDFKTGKSCLQNPDQVPDSFSCSFHAFSDWKTHSFKTLFSKWNLITGLHNHSIILWATFKNWADSSWLIFFPWENLARSHHIDMKMLIPKYRQAEHPQLKIRAPKCYRLRSFLSTEKMPKVGKFHSGIFHSCHRLPSKM